MREAAPAVLQASDAWLLMAAGLADRVGRLTLDQVIGAADAVQHAVPTREELNGAIGRLSRAGHVKWSSRGLRLTPAGRELFARSEREKRDTLRTQQQALERLLGVTSWSPRAEPRPAAGEEREVIGEQEYRQAVREYRRALGARY